mgnify:FL=1
MPELTKCPNCGNELSSLEIKENECWTCKTPLIHNATVINLAKICDRIIIIPPDTPITFFDQFGRILT